MWNMTTYKFKLKISKLEREKSEDIKRLGGIKSHRSAAVGGRKPDVPPPLTR